MKDDIEPHNFLISYSQDGIPKSAKKIPTIREYIDNLPKTASTFTLNTKQIDIQSAKDIPIELMEFLGAWPIPEYYATGKGRRTRYINPNNPDCGNYSDTYVTCECGAKVDMVANTDRSSFDNESHEENCVPYQRLAATSEFERLRWEKVQRLISLGLYAKEFAPRVNLSKKGCGQYARRYNTTMQKMRRQLFRPRAGLTYHILVRKLGVSGKKVAKLYDTSRAYLGRCAKEHANIDPEEENLRIDRRNGSVEWVKEKPPAKKPEWLQSKS